MKILSLFDGMACGALAMQAAGIEIDKYIAYEVDKYAIQTAQHNFPFIEERGDVFKADFTEYVGFDYLIGGSPCTYWSIAQTKNREIVPSGMGWELFSQYVRALHEAKPRFFLYENNKSMSAAIRASITETFGFEPILINSALVSAQNRQRLYWCGIRQADGTYKKADIQQPADRGILLKDIIETGVTWIDKSHTIDATYYKGGTLNGEKPHQNFNRIMVAEPICVNSKSGRAGVEGLQPSLIAEPVCLNRDTDKSVPLTASYYKYAATDSFKKANPRIGVIEPIGTTKQGKAFVVTANYSKGSDNVGDYVTHTLEKHVKSCVAETVNPLEKGNINAPIYEVKDGFITVKGNKYPIKLVDGFYIIRKLTVRECMRLQTVPEWYEWPVSKSQAYKMLGNGWTVEVIAHLLRGLK